MDEGRRQPGGRVRRRPASATTRATRCATAAPSAPGSTGGCSSRCSGRFDELATDECPFDPPPPAPVRRTARLGAARAGVEVAFAEWTFDGVVRQASFLGLRDDKDPREVVREPDATGLAWPARRSAARSCPNAAAGPESSAAGPSCRRRRTRPTDELARLDRLDHELGDAVAAVDVVRRRGDRC